MTVYLAALAAALFYLSALPVRAGALWKNGFPLRVGVMIGPFRFSAQADLKYTEENGPIASLPQDRSRKNRQLSLLRRAAGQTSSKNRMPHSSRAVKYLFSRLQAEQIRIYLHFALSDAARSAFLYGASNALLSALRAVYPSLPLNASVSVDFGSGKTQLVFSGILSCRLGHIILAGLIWLRDFLAWRIQAWTTSSPSKAS